jgi:hypothetical protein
MEVEEGSVLTAEHRHQKSAPFLDIAQIELLDPLRRCNQVLMLQVDNWPVLDGVTRRSLRGS